MEYLHAVFRQSPEIALFLALAGGYWIGKFQFGKFQLGGVAGSLLVAVALSQIGITIDTASRPFCSRYSSMLLALRVGLNFSARWDVSPSARS
jgi:uncharacterized transporter YbjL